VRKAVVVRIHGASRPEHGGGGEAEHGFRRDLRWLLGALSFARVCSSTR
jgi:hypothetical protein